MMLCYLICFSDVTSSAVRRWNGFWVADELPSRRSGYITPPRGPVCHHQCILMPVERFLCVGTLLKDQLATSVRAQREPLKRDRSERGSMQRVTFYRRQKIGRAHV